MQPDRFKQLEQLFHASLEQDPEQRDAFLHVACHEDEELEREVLSLLSGQSEASAFLENPAEVFEEGINLEELPSPLLNQSLGPYKILQLLGRGGMGEVYLAEDTRLERKVALKLLPEEFSHDRDRLERFRREAHAASALNHPNILTIHEIGEFEGQIYLVTEYIEGQTLRQRVAVGRLDLKEALEIGSQIGSALASAHQVGIVHRDLKPENIMLRPDGLVKVLDFGLAKVTPTGATATAHTQTGILLGTVAYMSPEQARGQKVDGRSDLFSLGVVLYEMVTGERPFYGPTSSDTLVAILEREPARLDQLRPGVPEALERIMARALAKNPDDRYQTASDLRTDLGHLNRDTEIGRVAISEGQDRKTRQQWLVRKWKPAMVLSRLFRSRSWKLGFVGILLAFITGSLPVWRVWQQLGKTAEKPKEMSFKPLTSYGWDNPLDSAAISPDGKYLAFCSNGKLLIQVIRSGEKRSISISEWFQPAGVSWFPDGTKLLLNRTEQQWIQVNGEMTRQWVSSLWSLSILGGTPQKIVSRAAFGSVSPDGSHVAFCRHDPQQQTAEIWMVGANGEEPRRIRAPSEPHQSYDNPVWFSNGQRLFYFRSDDKNEGIESCDLRGEQITTIFSSNKDRSLWGLCGAPNGRILFALAEVGLRASICNLWEIKVNTATGKPMSEAQLFTHWSGFNFMNADNLSITADGKQLALCRSNAQSDVYVAEAESGGKAMKNPRRLTLEESDDVVRDWTADSQAVLFESYRNGNGDIFKQNISQTDAEVIVTSPEADYHPNFSPDWTFILYLVSEKWGNAATRLMRVPVGGGPSELVLSGEKITNFSCAREAMLCVVDEEVDGKRFLTIFDPLKGRGEKLPLSDYPYFQWGILSPQGQLIEKMKPGPDGLHIRVRSLTGGPSKEITYKNLINEYVFSGWSLDGKGVYLTDLATSGSLLLYAGLDGHSQVLWKRGLSPGYNAKGVIQSPDGRHLAFTVTTYESNAWLLENF